ncbi:MAG: tetratricopeptide repeat protein, partial [Bdellovibrionales bacterium]|nr:tetratricopeptide repeat protein [Bdellovibrionales bacterium]
LNVQEALKHLRRLAQSAHLNGDHETHGWVLLRIAQILVTQHKIENAFRLLDEAHESFDAVRARFGMACVILEQARALHAINRNALALEKAHKAILSLQKMAQPMELGRAYDTIASIYARRLQRSESLIYAKKANAIFTEFQAPNSLAWNQCLMAGLYIDSGSLQEALALYKEALERFEKEHNKNGIAWVSLQMAIVHRRRCAFDSAETLIHTAQKFYDESNSIDRSALCWLELAAIRRTTADTEDALLLNRRALKVFTRLRQTENMARALLQMGLVLHDRGQLMRARELIKEAARLFRDIDHKNGGVHCDNALAAIELDRGDLVTAEALLQQATTQEQRWDIAAQRGWTKLNLARLAIEQGRLQQAAQILDIADAFGQKLEIRDLQAEVALVRSRYWLLLNDPKRLRESVQHAEAFVNAFRLTRLAARARILLAELLVTEGHSETAKNILEETARRCKLWRQRRRRAEALLGALQISRGARTLEELVLALSYIKRDARAVDAPLLQMMCQMANHLFRGVNTRLPLKKWETSPLFLQRKVLLDFFKDESNDSRALRAKLLEEGPADLHLLRPRDAQSALPISIVS